jgi:hypothetical protein
MALTSSELEIVDDSQGPVGMGRNDVRVATAATRQVRNRLSYTRATPAPQARGYFLAYFLAPTSVQIFTFTVSLSSSDPTTKVMAAMAMGYQSPE